MHFKVLALVEKELPEPEVFETLCERTGWICTGWLEWHEQEGELEVTEEQYENARYDYFDFDPGLNDYLRKHHPELAVMLSFKEKAKLKLLGNEALRQRLARLPAQDWPMDLIPSALITPDGEWHDPERYGCAGSWQYNFADQPLSEEETRQLVEWKRHYTEILDRHRNCIAYLLDAHA